MKLVRSMLLGLALMCAAAAAQAATVTLTFNQSVTRGGGAVSLPLAQIDHYNIYMQTDGGGFSLHHAIPPNSSGTNTTAISSLPVGHTYDFKVTCVDTVGHEGPFTTTTTANVVDPATLAPDAPTSISNTVS